MALVFIIFGWPRRTKEYGPAYPLFCDHCKNDTVYHYIKQRRWFSLFFIPFLPLSRSKHYLVCDICGASLELKQKDERKLAKQASKITESYLGHEVSNAEYYEAIDGLSEQSELFRGAISDPNKIVETSQEQEMISLKNRPD